MAKKKWKWKGKTIEEVKEFKYWGMYYTGTGDRRRI